MPFAKRAVVTISRADPGADRHRGDDRASMPAPFDEGQPAVPRRAGAPARSSARGRSATGTSPASRGTATWSGPCSNVENPAGTAWWGEGDEKIYVDGEVVPQPVRHRHRGLLRLRLVDAPSGSRTPITRRPRPPAHGFGGLFSMNRFHVLDPIPFARALRFDLEIWHWTDTTIAVDATLYWYARPGGTRRPSVRRRDRPRGRRPGRCRR